LKAIAALRKAKRDERIWRAKVSEAHAMYVNAVRSANKRAHKCRCAAQKERNRVWGLVANAKLRKKQQRAHAKCKMMGCILTGKNVRSKSCGASLPKLKPKKLAPDVAKANCRAHWAAERKTKEANVKIKERASKEKTKKERATKERVSKERAAKNRERAAKAKAREQAAKHHERRGKAAERSSKERSGKIERTNKARARQERANKAQLRVTRHWWGGWINNMDRNIHWQANGHTFVSGLRSFHHNGYEDRRFSPLLTNLGATQQHKHWSGWVNNMDAYFAYSCPTNYVMSGFISYHNNHYEDRRWRFQCAHFRGLGVRRGGWPGWQTNWDATFHIGCGHRPAVGFSSYHDNGREDRRWRVQCGSFYRRL